MIRYVIKSDINQILAIMEMVKDDFAGYKEKEFLEAVYNAINSDEAILEDDEGKKGVARRLIKNMSKWFTAGDIISVTTFQDSDPKGIPARACYHACGFVDDEKLTVFNYPCQKLVLRL